LNKTEGQYTLIAIVKNCYYH